MKWFVPITVLVPAVVLGISAAAPQFTAPVENGTSLNRLAGNKLGLNKLGANGVVLNGVSMNGPSLDGLPTPGSTDAADFTPVLRISHVTLADGTSFDVSSD